MNVHLVKGQEKKPEEEDVQEDFSERLSGLIGKLESEASRRVQLRTTVEKRWIDDLRQYHGKYSDELLSQLRKNKGSQLFINLTRPKTNAMMARLWDLLFPTDDRNWGIGPTPVPEMTENAEAAMKVVDEAQEAFQGAEARLSEAQEMPDGDEREAELQGAAGAMAEAETARDEAQAYADEIHASLEEAQKRADLMQEEIDDQLKECRYQAEARDAIADACKIGIGILKGPVLGEMRRRFQQAETGDGPSLFVLAEVPSETPAVYRVDPWSFFPDPDACKPQDSEGFYERHLLNKQKLRRLARRPDIDDDAVRELLRVGPDQSGMPQFMVDLQNLTGQGMETVKDRYHVWEYTGPLDADDMALLAEAMEDEETVEEMAEADPLTEYQAKVWFCQGQLLSFALHPLDSGEPIYSWFCPEPDEASPYGYGIPYLMRDDQSAVNGAQRAMMDNAGLSVGPQIVINKDAVSPEDGRWTLEPLKVWTRDKSKADPRERAFETYDIPNHQAELANIIGLSRQNIDEVTSMPQIAQGEQGSGVTKTAQGMALLMNSANVVFRRSIKNFDDDMTVPIMRRLYHWNMQFSEKDAIKGDYEVDARGSSVLLVREMQAQNLLMIAQMFGDHPIYGPMLKHGDLLRQIFRAHMIPAHEVLKSDREHKKFLEEQAKNPESPEAQLQMAELEVKREELGLKREELDAKVEIANMERDTRLKVAQMNYDMAMHKVAEALNMKREELDAKVYGEDTRAGDKSEAARIAAESSERRLAAEVAMKERTGDSSGGAV